MAQGWVPFPIAKYFTATLQFKLAEIFLGTNTYLIILEIF